MANIYGNNGNRWWVGQNVGETGGQSTVFGTPSTLFIGKPSGYESLPSGNAADDRQFAAAAKKNKGAAKPVTISVENVEWFNINGPYPTQKAADAAIPAIQKAHPAKGTVEQAATNSGVPVGWQQAIGTFFTDLTSQGTWVRVAKIVVGGAMVLIGLSRITGLDSAAKTAAKAAVL
jgi:hypothetical protein